MSPGTADERQAHWNATYQGKGETGVSWFEETPELSLEMIVGAGAGLDSSLIDIGGGASRLVDTLVARGWTSLTVLDISPSALDIARKRMGAAASGVRWIVGDVTQWEPEKTYDVWHDRAAFHFLTDPADRAAYADRLRRGLADGGHAVIATFAPDGPERCSGLPVVRYDSQRLASALGSPFELVESRRHVHETPWGSPQAFQISILRKC